MISETTIALVKSRADIVELVSESVRLTRRGRAMVGRCPFHNEKTPSFHVNAERGFFHCFGCKESGGVIDFAMRMEGFTFPEAIRWLADRAGIAVEDTATDAERREAALARRAKEDLYGVVAAAATFYERCLVGSAAHPMADAAVMELATRGLRYPDHGDVLRAFRVGYAPHGWDALATYLRQQGISVALAEKVGLVVPRTAGPGYYDRFRHRLMFAVHDTMGRVVAFSGRALPLLATTDGGTAPAKYINSPESPIYTKGDHLFGLHAAKQAIRSCDEAVLVEGNFDVVGLHARGVSNVIAPLGTAFTGTQARLLRRFTRGVVVMFDGDAAGRKATDAARGACREGGLTARVATLPRGADPDAVARRHGKAAIDRAVTGARGMLEYLIDEALDGPTLEGATLEGKAGRVQAVLRLLREEDDPTLRGLARTYADRLAAAVIVDGRGTADLAQLERDVAKALAAPKAKRGTRAGAPVGPALPDRIAEVLGAIVDCPGVLDDPAVQDALGAVDGDVALAVAAVAARRDRIADALVEVPLSLRQFVTARAVAPQYVTIAAAKRVVLDNCLMPSVVAPVPPDGDATDAMRLAKMSAAFSARREHTARARL